MTVTSVVRLDKKRSRVVLDEEVSLVLYPSDMRQFGIAEGKELSEDSYAALLESVLKPRARERVLRVLTVSDKTEKQLEDLLGREGYPKEVLEDAIAMVKQYRYIDDEAYGRRYVEQQGKKKSRKQLAFDMQKKGFSRELIDEVLARQPIDEVKQIKAFLRQKGIVPGERLDKEQYTKLVGRLARKGYSCEAIMQAIRAEEQAGSK